jgi:hypothetical protein
MDLRKPPKFIHHPRLIWVEAAVGFLLIVALAAAVAGARRQGDPRVVTLGQDDRFNMEPQDEAPPVVQETEDGEVIVREVSTGNWALHKDDAYHFSFRYPDESWLVQTFGDYTVLAPPNNLGRLEIATRNSARNSPVEAAERGQLTEGIFAETTVAGRSAVQWTCIACTGNRYARAVRITDLRATNWGQSNEIWYDFRLPSGLDRTEALAQVVLFDTLIDTFFIDTAFNPAAWPRYTNTDEGFSIAYPPGWGFREAIVGEGTDFIVYFGNELPTVGDGLRVYRRGNAEAAVGARRPCGEILFDLVRIGNDAEVDAMMRTFRCE